MWTLEQVGGPGLLDRGVCGRRAAFGQAQQRAEERRVLVAAEERRVHPGRRPGQAVHAERRVPGAGGLRALGRPGDRRRHAAVRRRAGRHRQGPGPDPLQGRPGVAGGRAGQGQLQGQRLAAAHPQGRAAAIVIVILLLTYRSPALWILPLSCVFVALTAAQAVIYLLARHAGLTVNGQTAFILTVLVFGAGTDYALLLTARYREELRRHADRHQAMAVALGRAGPAILASGSTVILSLLCLLVAELASTTSLGPVMAIGVAVGLCAMLTLLPALLVIFGRWMFWPRRPTLGSAEPTERGLWARIGARLARRPRLVWVVTAVVLGALALGLTGLKAEGLQNKDAFRTTPESV